MNHVTVVTPEAPLRERKKAQTRHAIEACALELFATRGYEATTIDAITSACDVSPRTFFRYFSSKDDLLHGDSDVRLHRLLQLLRERPADESPFAALRAAVVALTALYEDDREHILLRFKVYEQNPTLLSKGLESQHAWEQAVVAALDERHGAIGFLYDRLELRLIAAAAMAALRAAVDVWQADGGTRGLSDIVDQAFDRLGNGLGLDLDVGPGLGPDLDLDSHSDALAGAHTNGDSSDSGGTTTGSSRKALR